MVQNDVHNK